MKGNKFFNRELSWLSFNHRVLQEAKDPSNPLYERIKFLAIFSSNLDEFFRVRVASLRSLLLLKKKTQQELDFDPVKLLKEIRSKVNVLQDEIGHTFRKLIIPELRNHNIFLVNEKNLLEEHTEFVNEYFNELVLPHINPMLLAKKKFTPFLRNNRLYLTVKLSAKSNKKTQDDDSKKRKKFIYSIVEIPSNHLPRFIELPKIEEKMYVIFLDDIIRYCLPQIFHGYQVIASYSIKLTRDAELYIEDEFSGDLLEKIKKGIKKRTTGVPCRFLYDPDMPKELIKFLKDSLFLNKADLMSGGKYHNFKDFFNYPKPGLKELEYESFIPLKLREYDLYKDKFEAWSKQDFLFHFPYHTYNYVVEALKLAAADPNVKSIKITQYR
ncbi:MAG: polyphosphate kinase 1, partial [Ignavibacteria bacterium]